jgi:hypothetical protein
MKRQGAVVIFLTLVFVFSMHAYAHAFQADILPFEISSGEAFIIKVTSTKNSKLPVASLNGKQFYFSSCGEGCFIAIGAIGIETKPGVYTIMLRVGKEKKNLRLVVKHTSYQTLSLTLPEDIVSKGDIIGLVGSSGRSSGPHLHFGVKVANININPVSLIKLNL